MSPSKERSGVRVSRMARERSSEENATVRHSWNEVKKVWLDGGCGADRAKAEVKVDSCLALKRTSARAESKEQREGPDEHFGHQCLPSSECLTGSDVSCRARRLLSSNLMTPSRPRAITASYHGACSDGEGRRKHRVRPVPGGEQHPSISGVSCRFSLWPS